MALSIWAENGAAVFYFIFVNVLSIGTIEDSSWLHCEHCSIFNSNILSNCPIDNFNYSFKILSARMVPTAPYCIHWLVHLLFTHQNVKSSILAFVLVATWAPVLPLSGLTARSLLPHHFGVIKALRMLAIGFKRKVLFRFYKKKFFINKQIDHRYENKTFTRIVVLELALRAAHHHVLAAPRELLYVRTVVGQRHRTTVISLLTAWNMSNRIEILKFLGQRFLMPHQIAQCHRIPVVRALRLQWIAFYLWAKWMNGATPGKF